MFPERPLCGTIGPKAGEAVRLRLVFAAGKSGASGGA